ncbi:MAG: hypothetical protein HQM07_06970 [Zetaproteobacteria bacterium]|nr:hypothetical protein [Zetaproteobacteria bacterium]
MVAGASRSALLILMLFVMVLPVDAAQWGSAHLDSYLDQPLRANIVLSKQGVGDEVDVTLASASEYGDQNIFYAKVLAQTQVLVEEQGISWKIFLTSAEPVRDAFLTLLLKLTSDGLVEYKKIAFFPMHEPLAPVPTLTTSPIGANDVKGAEHVTEVLQPSSKPSSRRLDRYGPVKTGESLTVLARQLKEDPMLSTEQYMMAIFERNPKAFLRNNINGLKAGYYLQLPHREAVLKYSSDEASKQVSEQNYAWHSHATPHQSSMNMRISVVSQVDPSHSVSHEVAKESSADVIEVVPSSVASDESSAMELEKTALLDVIAQHPKTQVAEVVDAQQLQAENLTLQQQLAQKDAALIALGEQLALVQQRSEKRLKSLEEQMKMLTRKKDATDAPTSAYAEDDLLTFVLVGLLIALLVVLLLRLRGARRASPLASGVESSQTFPVKEVVSTPASSRSFAVDTHLKGKQEGGVQKSPSTVKKDVAQDAPRIKKIADKGSAFVTSIHMGLNDPAVNINDIDDCLRLGLLNDAEVMLNRLAQAKHHIDQYLIWLQTIITSGDDITLEWFLDYSKRKLSDEDWLNLKMMKETLSQVDFGKVDSLNDGTSSALGGGLSSDGGLDFTFTPRRHNSDQ